jgi:hypothetical protein
MTATRKDIKEWVDEAQKKGARYLIVAVDTWDYDNYPVYVMPGEDIRKKYSHYQGRDMQRVDEVYSFTGLHSVESQLKEHRAMHFD